MKVFDRWGYAGGATDDWYKDIGIEYSYTWELPERDEDGFHGFELPPKNIIRVKHFSIISLIIIYCKLQPRLVNTFFMVS